MPSADSKTIKQSLQRAISYGLSRKLSLEDAKDFAQDYVVKTYVDGKSRWLESSFVDFLRKTRGDSRLKVHELRKSGRIDYDKSQPLTPEQLCEIKEEREANLNYLTARQRSIVIDVSTYGQFKAADRAGLTQTRVSQIIADVRVLMEIKKAAQMLKEISLMPRWNKLYPGEPIGSAVITKLAANIARNGGPIEKMRTIIDENLRAIEGCDILALPPVSAQKYNSPFRLINQNLPEKIREHHAAVVRLYKASKVSPAILAEREGMRLDVLIKILNQPNSEFAARSARRQDPQGFQELFTQIERLLHLDLDEHDVYVKHVYPTLTTRAKTQDYLDKLIAKKGQRREDLKSAKNFNGNP